MVKDHSDSEKGNPLPPHRLLIDYQQGFFYMHHSTDRITHTTAFVTPVVEHWLEQEIAQWVHPRKELFRVWSNRWTYTDFNSALLKSVNKSVCNDLSMGWCI